MDRFLDEAARILAGPMPRRRAVALLGGALLAAMLGAHPSAQDITCSGGCPDGHKCCPGSGGNNFCILNEFICSNFISCGNGGACNNQNNDVFCCGSKCCNKSNTICCGNLNC